MTNYILIDAKTRAPVPLPFYTSTPDLGGVAVHDVVNDLCQCTSEQGPVRLLPSIIGLVLITEEQFMAERDAPSEFDEFNRKWLERNQ